MALARSRRNESGFNYWPGFVDALSTLILAIVGLWVLVVLSRPIEGIKLLVIGAMGVALVLVYTIPFVADFLQFVNPTLPTAVLIVATVLVAIAGLEVVRFFHRRYVARMEARLLAATPVQPL